MQPRAFRSASGFTLLETLIATSVLVTVLAGVAQLFVLSVRFAGSSGRRGLALTAAQAKIEDLRSRRLGYDAAGDPVTDPVLTPSPPGALSSDADGYSDALDANGEVISADEERAGTFARRWAITRVDDLVPEALVIEVCVFREPAGDAPLAAAEACLSTIRVRQP
jgi:type II secretory pathway pseudopilin PulG